MFRSQLRLQRRHFSKVEISNPWGIFFLRQSRSVLKAIVLFYGSALTLGVVGYYGTRFYVDKYQEMAKEWPIQAKISGRLGVFYQDVRDNEESAELAIIYALKSIAEEEGLQIESEDNKKFSLLNLEQLNGKSKEWKCKYVDMVVRLAILKGQLGDLENSWKLCHYAINLPMDLGSTDLKSKALRLAARLDRQKGEFQKSESYLLDAIRFNELNKSGIIFQDQGSNLLSTNSEVPQELFESLVDLGVTYTQMEDYTKSLEIFLNLLQILDKTQFQVSDKPMLKNYIGEILYKKGLTGKSIEWCRTAFKEAYVHSKSDIKSAYITKQALTNLVALYQKSGDEELGNQAQEQLANLSIPMKDPSGTFLLEKMFT